MIDESKFIDDLIRCSLCGGMVFHKDYCVKSRTSAEKSAGEGDLFE